MERPVQIDSVLARAADQHYMSWTDAVAVDLMECGWLAVDGHEIDIGVHSEEAVEVAKIYYLLRALESDRSLEMRGHCLVRQVFQLCRPRSKLVLRLEVVGSVHQCR